MGIITGKNMRKDRPAKLEHSKPMNKQLIDQVSQVCVMFG